MTRITVQRPRGLSSVQPSSSPAAAPAQQSSTGPAAQLRGPAAQLRDPAAQLRDPAAQLRGPAVQQPSSTARQRPQLGGPAQQQPSHQPSSSAGRLRPQHEHRSTAAAGHSVPTGSRPSPMDDGQVSACAGRRPPVTQPSPSPSPYHPHPMTSRTKVLLTDLFPI